MAEVPGSIPIGGNFNYLKDIWIRLMAASIWVKVAQPPCWPSRGQQVSHQRWISGIARRQDSMQAISTLALKPRADITRSPKQGYQWPHEKDMCPPKIKNIYIYFKRYILYSHSRVPAVKIANLVYFSKPRTGKMEALKPTTWGFPKFKTNVNPISSFC